MTVQSSFTHDATRYRPGDLVDAGFTDKISRTAKAAIQFGSFVSRRASPADTPEECGPPEDSAAVTARGYGFALKNQLNKAATGYESNDQVTILKRGRVAVTCETAWTDGAAVFVRFQDPGSSFLGAVRNDADTADAVAAPGCRFVGTGSGAGTAIVEINTPA